MPIGLRHLKCPRIKTSEEEQDVVGLFHRFLLRKRHGISLFYNHESCPEGGLTGDKGELQISGSIHGDEIGCFANFN